MSKLGFGTEVAWTVTCGACGAAATGAGAASDGSVVCACAWAGMLNVRPAMSRWPAAAQFELRRRICISLHLLLRTIGLLPCADATTTLVEDPDVIALAYLEAGFWRELTEHR